MRNVLESQLVLGPKTPTIRVESSPTHQANHHLAVVKFPCLCDMGWHRPRNWEQISTLSGFGGRLPYVLVALAQRTDMHGIPSYGTYWNLGFLWLVGIFEHNNSDSRCTYDGAALLGDNCKCCAGRDGMEASHK
jgi:hypothetical protein